MSTPFDFSELTQALLPQGGALSKLPQTQRDIRTIAQTAEQFQSPDVQQRIAQIEAKIETAAKTQILLQMISTAALVGMFILTLKRGKDDR